MLEHPDATVQKKSYRLLKRLIDSGNVGNLGVKLDEFVVKLGEAGGGVGPGAQRVSRAVKDIRTILTSVPGSTATAHVVGASPAERQSPPCA